MGLSQVDSCPEYDEIQQLTMKHKLLKLQLEMIEAELRQAEMLKTLQSNRGQTTAVHEKNVKIPTNSDALDTAIVELSKCDYYHGAMTSQHSWFLLAKCKKGTFLVRQSQTNHSRYPFAISFQRGVENGGAASIRICLDQASWRLDCQDPGSNKEPSFSTISGLIQYYRDLPDTSDNLVKLTFALTPEEV